MQYIVHRRFKEKAICGYVNIPAQTVCEVESGFIMYNGKQLCATRSENAHIYFAVNDDGLGMKRGALTRKIINTLKNKDDLHQKRWDAVWDDQLCQKYRRHNHDDHWLWNHLFFNADIKDLQYILKLVDIKP